MKGDNVDKGKNSKQLKKRSVSPADTLSNVCANDKIENYLVRFPKTVKDLNLCIIGKFMLFDAKEIIFVRFLANCIMIVLSKIASVC